MLGANNMRGCIIYTLIISVTQCHRKSLLQGHTEGKKTKHPSTFAPDDINQKCSPALAHICSSLHEWWVMAWRWPSGSVWVLCEWTTGSSLLSAVVNVNIDPVYSGSEEEEECHVLERGWGTGRPIDRWGNACVGEPVVSECPGKTKASSWRKWMQRTRRQKRGNQWQRVLDWVNKQRAAKAGNSQRGM